MTGEQMIRAAEEDDWWLFAVSGALLLLPFASGKLAKGLSKSDEAVDVAQVSSRTTVASGSNLIKQSRRSFCDLHWIITSTVQYLREQLDTRMQN